MRKTLFLLLSCTTLLLAGYASFRGYRVWKQEHMMALAEACVAKSDLRNAVLSINQVLRTNPRNADACRLLADLAEGTRSPGALLWRSRVVEINPKAVGDRLALARSALLMHDFVSATNALEGVSAAGKQTAAYQNTAGLVAISLSQISEAENHFAEAARLEPTNAAPRLNLAVIRLRSTNATAATHARATLKALSTDAIFNCQALRELVADAVRSRQTNEAVRLSRELAQSANSVFGDKVVRLELLRSLRDPEFQDYLTVLQREAGTDLDKIYELATWEMVANGPARALAWIGQLPTEVKTNQVVILMSAGCRANLQDWRGLILVAEQEHWGELEFVRHAFMARAMRGLDLVSSSMTEWERAMKAGANRKENLVMLLHLVIQWNWAHEQEQVLWALVNEFPGERWAISSLAQVLFGRGRTQALLRLFSQLARANPADLPAKNNMAITALLLNAHQLKPHEMAREVYTKSPTNASYASTYAYSLFMQEKKKEALHVIEQLQAGDLEKPSIAAYYGLLLDGLSEHPKALKYLDIAAKGRLLPEEQRLVQQALGGGEAGRR